MSKARSPREVCSTTMGIRGISLLLAAGGPKFWGLGRLLLLRRPDRLARFVQLRRDGLDLGHDAVERLLQADVVADAVGAALGDELVDVLVGLAGRTQLLADLLVRDLNAELVGNHLEHELARDRHRGLGAQASLEHLGRLARQLEVGVGVDAPRLEAASEPGQKLARPRLDERARGAELRRLDELVDRGRTEEPFELVLDLPAQPALDLGPQLVEGVEL